METLTSKSKLREPAAASIAEEPPLNTNNRWRVSKLRCLMHTDYWTRTSEPVRTSLKNEDETQPLSSGQEWKPGRTSLKSGMKPPPSKQWEWSPVTSRPSRTGPVGQAVLQATGMWQYKIQLYCRYFPFAHPILKSASGVECNPELLLSERGRGAPCHG